MNKQIEEMVCNACITKPTCTDMEKAKCMRRNFAICVIKQDYRKASEVAREIFAEIEQVKKEIVDRMQEFINEWKQYSESTVDYFGGKYDAMETASRIVKSILTDKTVELKKKYESEGGK